MIAIDTSSFIAYLQGEPGKDVELLDEALKNKQAVLPPAVLTELLSDSSLPKDLVGLMKSLPMLEVSEGYWERTGSVRAALLAKGYRARLADSLITQSCLDHQLALITRGADFKAFSSTCGLILAN